MRQDQNTIISNGSHQHTNGSSGHPLKNDLSSPVNGHTSPTNGIAASHKNGYSSHRSKTKASTFYGHDREEVTRLMIQGLQDLGYQGAANNLSQESGCEVESPTVAAFRSAVLDGEWAEAESILLGNIVDPDGGGVSIRNGHSQAFEGLRLLPKARPDHLRFLIREQKYLELLERQDTGKAILVLQTELQPLDFDAMRLNTLSELLVCKDTYDFEQQAHWDGAHGRSRYKLLSELSRQADKMTESISPSVMIPQHRLAVLLDQIKQAQISRCLYHSPANRGALSIFEDHMCDSNEFPLTTIIELAQSSGEVWFVEFSHDGRYLAASGESATVVVYDTTSFTPRYKFSDHGGKVVYLCWSPDDSKLITCSSDSKARIWDMATSRAILTVDHNAQTMTTAAWTPDGSQFVTGSLDKQEQLCLWTIEGRRLYTWPVEQRIQDCAISPDGQRLITISSDVQITVYNLQNREEEYSIVMKQKMTCLSISRDSKYMLINMTDNEIDLIDIESADIVRRYLGQKQGSFIIRSCFGGTDDNLIISGSQDSQVYIWHRENGTLIETLKGHGNALGRDYGCVNSVTWNPKDPGMFASAGDDRKVRIWAKESEPAFRRRSSHSSHRSHRQSLIRQL